MTTSEKQQLLYEFNHPGTGNIENKTIHELFTEQAEQTPEKTAVCAPVNPDDIFTPTSCFKKNPFIYQRDLECPGKITLTLLKTHGHNSVLVNTPMARILDLFDGKRSIKSIFSLLETVRLKPVIYPLEVKDILEITFNLDGGMEKYPIDKFENFVHLMKSMYKKNLIVPQGFVEDQPEAGKCFICKTNRFAISKFICLRNSIKV